MGDNDAKTRKNIKSLYKKVNHVRKSVYFKIRLIK